jgi:type IV pilus assembly protein PilW
MMRASLKYHFSRGLSLVELMVALAVGLLLTAAIMQIFLSTKNTYRIQESMARLQENGRFAVSYLVTDLRMAGYMGCGNIDRIPINIIASGLTNTSFGSDVIIGGLNNVGPTNAWSAVAGTDTLIIRKAASGSMRLTGNLGTVNANIQVSSNTSGVKAGDILFISDCLNADIFKASSVSDGTGTITMAHASSTNSSNNLSKAYGSEAEVLLFESVAYFIRDSGRTTSDGGAIRSLYVQRETGNTAEAATAYELVEGVQDMQVEYGVDTSGNGFADAYYTANNVTDWAKVVSARFSLLLQGVEGKVLGSSGAMVQALNYNGSAIAADGRLRQVFGSAVAIRNRVP